jgi:8-oxo-dGTP pyrophosphatase MutT (NUDIX family)
MKKFLENKDFSPLAENPWKILARKKIYENPWILVQEDEVINPSGGRGIYGTVSFKNKALGIVPVDEEGCTWLVGQYRYPLNEYSWEIPMGGGKIVENGKDFETQLLEAAQRELLEETGLVAQKWTKIARIHTSNSVTDEEGFVFLAQELSQTDSSPEETEKLEVIRIPLSQALQMVMDDKITDAISMIGIMKVAKMLKIFI